MKEDRWADAWEAAENLSLSERSSSAGLQVRVACAAHVERWDLGEVLAEMLAREKDEVSHEAAATFFHALACHRMGDGSNPDLNGARIALRRALEIWPAIATVVQEDLGNACLAL